MRIGLYITMGSQRPQKTQRFSQRAGTVGGRLSHPQPARENLDNQQERDIGHRDDEQLWNHYGFLNNQDHKEQHLRKDMDVDHIR